MKPKTPRAPCVAHQLWEHLLIAIDTTILRSLDNTFNPTLYQPKNTHFHQTTLNKTPQPTPLSEGFLELGIPPHLTVLRFALQCDRHSLPVWPRCDWHGKRNSYKDSGSWHFRVIFKSPKGRNSSAVSIYPKRIIMCYLCDIKKNGLFSYTYNYFTIFYLLPTCSLNFNHLQIVLTSPKHIQIRPTSVWAFIRRRGSLANARSLGAEI